LEEEGDDGDQLDVETAVCINAEVGADSERNTGFP
jgi:hypothetical protein